MGQSDIKQKREREQDVNYMEIKWRLNLKKLLYLYRRTKENNTLSL